MDIVRLATDVEIEGIKDQVDLQFVTKVFSYGDARAAFRLAPEIDPVLFGSLSNNGKRAFMAFLEAHLRLSGIGAYYFHVDAGPEMEQYRSVVENWGAIRVNPNPEIHYKKPL